MVDLLLLALLVWISCLSLKLCTYHTMWQPYFYYNLCRSGLCALYPPVSSDECSGLRASSLDRRGSGVASGLFQVS